MNGKLNTENYQYRVSQLYRDDLLRAAEQQHLANEAIETPEPSQPLFARLIEDLTHLLSSHRNAQGGQRLTVRRGLTKVFGAALIVAMLLVTPAISRAQQAQPDMNDPGQPIEYPERVHYFVGMYFYERGNYGRAIEEFTVTIERLPQLGEAYAARADSYAALQQYDLAADDYARALELNAEDPSVEAKFAAVAAAFDDLQAADANSQQRAEFVMLSES